MAHFLTDSDTANFKHSFDVHHRISFKNHHSFRDKRNNMLGFFLFHLHLIWSKETQRIPWWIKVLEELVSDALRGCPGAGGEDGVLPLFTLVANNPGLV